MANTTKSESDAERDCQRLVDAFLPFAERMLAQHGEFFPFGGTMTTGGEIAASMASTGEDSPPPQEVIEMLRAGFRDEARRGTIRATILVYDSLIVPPGKTSKQDAVTVALDHRDDHSVVKVFPYTRTADGAVHFDASLVHAGSHDVFPP